MGANPPPTKIPTRAAAVNGSSINAALANSIIFFIKHLCHGYQQFYVQTVTYCDAKGYWMLRLAVRLRTTTTAEVQPAPLIIKASCQPNLRVSRSAAARDTPSPKSSTTAQG